MNKDLIIKRFAKSLNTYDDNAIVQKVMAKKLLSYLDRKEFGNILEIGCGTGLLTKLVDNNILFGKYDANDIVEDCYKYIKSINPKINFIGQDIEKYVEQCDKYDLIISNASLQWVSNFEVFIKTLYKKLNNNGILLISTFGKENFKEIYYSIGKSLEYFSKLELEQMFKNYYKNIEEDIITLNFKTPKEVLKHLHLTGVNSLQNMMWTKGDLFKFEEKYNKYCNNAPILTYNPIYIMIRKNLK